ENTLYYYKITVTDTNSVSAEYAGSFRTASIADVIPPIISGVVVSANASTANISWSTNELADSQINYGFTTSYGSNFAELTLGLNHSINLGSLIPSTTYHFRLISTDGSGNSASTVDATFATQKDSAPPPDVSSFFLATTSNSIILNWSNPIVGDFAGVKVLRKIGSQSANSSDGTLVYVGSGSAFTDTEVLINLNYYYTIFSLDTSGNVSSGIFRNGKILFTPGAEICANGIDDNLNGDVDCADSACSGTSACAPSAVPEVCNNSLDDDADSAIDCADSDCGGSAYCAAPPSGGGVAEVCNNGVDDDVDGKIDCSDENCFGFSGCGSGSYLAACKDGNDNDGDAKIDFPADSGCENSDDADEYNPADSTVPSFAKIALNDLNFYVGSGNIKAWPRNGAIEGLANADLTVSISKNGLAGQPKSIVLKVGDTDQHQFVYNVSESTYYTNLAFNGRGETQAYLEIDYGSGQLDSVGFKILSLPNGDVFDNNNNRLSGVELALYRGWGERISTESYGKPNPAISDTNGNYGWVVPNGEYFIVLKKDGYFDRTTAVQKVENNIVNFRISLIARPQKLADAINPDATIGDNVQNVAKNLAAQAAAVTQVTLQKVEAIVDNPAVENVAKKIVAPTAISVVVVGVIPLISWLDFLPFLRLLFLQPLMMLGWRKRAKWGLVYNALNKQPIDLAMVRLFNAENGKLVQSKVTDPQGHYIFIVNPGKYKIEVKKNNYVFPTNLLKEFKSDGQKIDLYHGEIIEVAEKNASITANIPVDPVGARKKPARLIFEKIGRKLQLVLSWAGIIVTGISLYISPKWYLAVLLAVHVGLFFLFRRLSMPMKTKGWGIVVDSFSKKPLGKVIARLFNSQFNKLVAIEITDKKGRYSFLAGDDSYYITYEHRDYQPLKTDDIDLKGKPSETISKDVDLKKY
ncbi:MAG: fibronectin type III domain-containing protein, partial [Patescibacteria group bacterium]